MTRISIRNSHLYRYAPCAAGIAGALLLTCASTACASTPPEPTVALKAAEQAIAAADRTRVADAASPELSEAREKLTAAQAAAQDKRMAEAERLALESRVDAELASARIEASKARAVNDEIEHSTGTLTQEMDRKSGDTP
jgi:hypothetical protein